MATENNRNTRLQKLSGSDFEIVDGEPDIRGWDVKDESGNLLGEVEELIFDYESLKVRYLVVELDDDDDNDINDGNVRRDSNLADDTNITDNDSENSTDMDDREVLVPIGIATLHEKEDDVILTGVTMQQLRSLPEYDEDHFDADHETSVRNVFGGLGASGEGNTSGDFYNHDHFNEQNLYRNRKLRNEGNDETIIPGVKDESLLGKDEMERRIRLRSRNTTGNDMQDNQGNLNR